MNACVRGEGNCYFSHDPAKGMAWMKEVVGAGLSHLLQGGGLQHAPDRGGYRGAPGNDRGKLAQGSVFH